MRQNVFVTHKIKKPKTRSALYEIEYQLKYILKKKIILKNYESKMTRG